jgi:transposase-like protein
MLNERGQCPICKRKPTVYKRKHYKFCARCNRSFDIETGEQVENWAYKKVGPLSFECDRFD